MKRHLLTASVAALTVILIPGLALAQAESNDTKPLKPGGVRVFTRAPEPDKWNFQNVNNGAQRIFRCKPLACPDPETVTFTFLKSPTRKPDPRALEKFAKVDLPKSLRATMAAIDVMSDRDVKIETIVAKADTVKDYPAAVNESKLSSGKKTSYLMTTIVFAGPAMIRIQSVSANRDLAQKSLGQFIEVMKITEGPPLPPPPEPSAPKPPAAATQPL